MLLARERYSFVPWVVVFLALTWASTLFFGRAPKEDVETPGLGREVTSYLTRTLYQETLFFLLPFYAYSSVFGSLNMVFVGLLAGLAILSCLDLVFDRLLNTHATFAMLFFVVVAFAALDLLLPMVFGLNPSVARPIAALAAVGSAFPLAWGPGIATPRGKSWSIAAGVGMLVVLVVTPGLVPPVPLRMQDVIFGSQIDEETLEIAAFATDRVPINELNGRLIIRVGVFAPSSVPATVRLEWRRDGEVVKESRPIKILAHESVFRVWDGLREDLVPILPGSYKVTLSTGDGGVFGTARIEVVP